MAMKKYRIHQVAKDFLTSDRHIAEILKQYDISVKNHMQVLSCAELDIVFEYITQRPAEYIADKDKGAEEKNHTEHIANEINSENPVVVINWSDETYYVVNIDDAMRSQLIRNKLVKLCSDQTVQFDTYEEAAAYAKRYSSAPGLINIDDYPYVDPLLIEPCQSLGR